MLSDDDLHLQCKSDLCPLTLIFLFLTEHHNMKAYGGVEIQLHALLTSGLD